MNSKELLTLADHFGAHNYAPLDVIISEGEGSWMIDVDGTRYLDMLSAYSALNFGHRNARINRIAHAQLDRLTLTCRAFHSEELILFCKELAEFCGMEMVLPMNSGAEAVETSIKAARKWGYEVKGVQESRAEIIVFDNNFHGRTTTIAGFSTSPETFTHYGPFTPGFKIVPYGDAAAVENAISPDTVAVLVEPIQGEGGVIIPPEGFLRRIREQCSKSNVLLIADEIQTGLCRTGKIFCCDHEGVVPDLYLIGKSLGGGIVPISAVVGKRAVLNVFTPGTHGSTFGGNPFACAIAREVLRLIQEEKPEHCAKESGEYFVSCLKALKTSKFGEIRSRGLFIGVDIPARYGAAKKFCTKLKNEGVLCKDTRSQTIRFAPPLFISRDEIDYGLERIARVFAD